ncbi:MAG: hypothetical protein V3S26_09930 [Acidimicrobiia bacterium]
MLSQRFEQLFRLLLVAFLRYDDVARDAHHVVDLAVARSDLDELRSAMANERHVVMRLGRSSVRDEAWLDQSAAARSELFTMAHTSN